MPASRVIVSSPSTHGAIGFTTDLEPSMTLGCGSWGGNVTSDNISPRHLVDVKRIAFETQPINHALSEERPGAVTYVADYSDIGQRSHVDVKAIEALVDKFLKERNGDQREENSRSTPLDRPLAAGEAHPVQINEPATQAPPAPSPGEASPASGPPLSNGHVHDFVCEDDVKRAISSRQKIHINSKTIITPAARDLGQEHDIFSRRQ